MNTYKVVVKKQNPKVNEDGKQEYLAVTRGKGGLLAIPCYEIKTEIVATGLSFSEAKTFRKEHKNSEIVKEQGKG